MADKTAEAEQAEPSTNDDLDTEETLEGVSDADYSLDETEESEPEEAATESEEESKDDGESQDSQDESEEEQSPKDAEPEEAEDSDEESKEQSEEESSDEEPSEDLTPSEDKSPARKAWEEREARRQAQKQQQQEEFLDAAEDDKDLAVRQLQVDAYNNRIERNANKLQNDIDWAVANIDLFQDGTKEQKDKLLREIDKWEAIHVRKDRNGDPVEVTGNLKQYLQEEAESIRRLAGVGARQEVRNKSKTKAKTLTPPASKPKETPKDPWISAFEEEAGL